MTKLAASQARVAFSDTLNRVAYRGERIVLRRRGKDLAAIIPMADLKLIEEREDEIDVREARNALAEMKRKGEKPIPYATVRKRLGLK
jgi:prevent-host-death family protein